MHGGSGDVRMRSHGVSDCWGTVPVQGWTRTSCTIQIHVGRGSAVSSRRYHMGRGGLGDGTVIDDANFKIFQIFSRGMRYGWLGAVGLGSRRRGRSAASATRLRMGLAEGRASVASVSIASLSIAALTAHSLSQRNINIHGHGQVLSDLNQKFGVY